MKKVNLTTKIEPVAVAIEPQSPESPASAKGWNYQSINNPRPNAKFSSITEIIQMEQKSKENYKKLKNRPLHLIQIEEKAIEDLKKFYNCDSLFDVNIRVELVDEEFAECAPVWKTK